MLSTHIVEDVHQICDELAVLRRGRLFYAGKSENLMKQVEGKVKILFVDNETQLAELQKQTVVLSTTYENRGISARIMDERMVFSQIRPVPATLEDAYVYCMGGKVHG